MLNKKETTTRFKKHKRVLLGPLDGDQGPFWGPFYKGAILKWDPKRDLTLENHSYAGFSDPENPQPLNL